MRLNLEPSDQWQWARSCECWKEAHCCILIVCGLTLLFHYSPNLQIHPPVQCMNISLFDELQKRFLNQLKKDWFGWLAVLLFCLSKPIDDFLGSSQWRRLSPLSSADWAFIRLIHFQTGAAMTCWWTPSLRWSIASPRSGLRSTFARSTFTINPFPVSLENGVRMVRKQHCTSSDRRLVALAFTLILSFKRTRSEKQK